MINPASACRVLIVNTITTETRLMVCIVCHLIIKTRSLDKMIDTPINQLRRSHHSF